MITKIDALVSLRPGAEWSWYGDYYSGLEWLDKIQSKPTAEEIDAEVIRLEQLEPIRIAKENRLNAYRAESDPLFFKAQRGESTMQEWMDKVAEIKARYPEG